MSEESKLSADGLEVVKLQHMAVSESGELRWMSGRGHPKGLEYCELYALPDFGGATEPLCRLTDAQRLLADLREELAQRDQTIASLRQHKTDYMESAEQTRKALRAENARQRSVYIEDSKRLHDLNTLITEQKERIDALESQQAASVGGEHVPDEVFQDEFQVWWEDHGQFCRAGGGNYERAFAFQAWRHLYPMLMQARAALSPAGGGNDGE